MAHLASEGALKLPVIDSDGHVMEPFSMWSERLPREYRHLAWTRAVASDGTETLSFAGHNPAFEMSIGSLCTPGALSAGGCTTVDLEQEVDRGAHDPQRRLELMDAQGIAVSVLFPTITLGLDDLPDSRFASASARAYNGWIADFCAADRERLRWAAAVPLRDLDWALAETDRALSAGATTVMLSPIPTPGGRNLGSEDMPPLLDWAEGGVVTLHSLIFLPCSHPPSARSACISQNAHCLPPPEALLLAIS